MGYSYLNLISFIGIFALCAIAWIFSEDRRVIPWRVIIGGIVLQLILGFLVFQFEPTRKALVGFSSALDGVFAAADAGARFVFGGNLVPPAGSEPFVLRAVPPSGKCTPPQVSFLPGFCGTDRLNFIFAFRSLPAVIFFSALMELLYNLKVIQVVTNVFAKIFYSTMRLSGAEALSGAANIFVGIEAAIAVKPYIPKMTRSELCAILACCFGTAASSTLAIYVGFLRSSFPNILGHLVSASIIAIPACFVLSKILVPETSIPLTAGGIPIDDAPKFDPEDDQAPVEEVGGEPMERVSPLDAAIQGALSGVKMAVSIAAVLILIVGLIFLLNQIWGALGELKTFGDPVAPGAIPPWYYGVIESLSFAPFLIGLLSILAKPIGFIFSVLTLQNLEGLLFYIPTLLTGVQAEPGKLFNCLLSVVDGRVCVPDESWRAAVIIGRRLTETAIPPYQELGRAAAAGELSNRTVLIISYALSGFAHIASVGIFVGGTIALAPTRRRDISRLGWKALFVGTLATLMIACIAGVYDNGNPSIFGEKPKTPPVQVLPSPAVSPTVTPSVSPSPITSPTTEAIPTPTVSPSVSSPTPTMSPKP